MEEHERVFSCPLGPSCRVIEWYNSTNLILYITAALACNEFVKIYLIILRIETLPVNQLSNFVVIVK